MNQGSDQWEEIQHSENEETTDNGQTGQKPPVNLGENRPQAPSPADIAARKYNGARANLLFATVISFINVVVLALGSGFYMLFSAFLPLALTSSGVALFEAGEAQQSFVYIMAGVSILVTLPYLLCWIFSKRHYAWMIVALVYFAIDCVIMLVSFDVSLILDVVFHIWVMYYLIVGVKYGVRLDRMKKEAQQQPPQNPQNGDFDGWDHFEQ